MAASMRGLAIPLELPTRTTSIGGIVERQLWGETFSRSDFPAFLCPHCKQGRLAPDPSTLRIEEPKFSLDAHGHNDWEPDWIDERFVVFLRCPILKCGQIVSVGGDSVTDQVWDEEAKSWGLEQLLRPRMMFPAPSIIELPKDAPDDLARQLDLSFQVFWADYGACATKLRTSVERLMDFYGVPKTRIRKDAKNPTKPGKRVPLELSSRIDKFVSATSNNVHADTLHALRHIGNLGTHNRPPSHTALLDAYMIYEHALAELLGNKKKELAALAKKILKTKGKY